MANLPSLNAYVTAHIVPSATNVVFKYSPLFIRARTRHNFKFEGGLQIQQPIVPFKLKGGPFGRAQALDTAWVNTEDAYAVKIKYYYVSVVLLGQDGALNRGPESALSQATLKLGNAAALMGELVATDIYLSGLNNANVITNLGTDSGTLAIDGLAQWVDDGTNVTSVGSIVRTTIGTTGVVGGGNGYWKGTIGALATTDLNTAFAQTSFGPDEVDLVSLSPVTWSFVLNRLQGNQRFNREDTDLAKAGFRSIAYLGADLIKDNYAPAGAIVGLNTNYFQFWTSSNPLFQFG